MATQQATLLNQYDSEFELEQDLTKDQFIQLLGRLVQTMGQDADLTFTLNQQPIHITHADLNRACYDIELEVEDDEVELELTMKWKRNKYNNDTDD